MVGPTCQDCCSPESRKKSMFNKKSGVSEKKQNAPQVIKQLAPTFMILQKLNLLSRTAPTSLKLFLKIIL